MFRVGLDVFEVTKQNNFIHIVQSNCSKISFPSSIIILPSIHFLQDEPHMKPGLAEMKNAIVVPHIASASKVTILKIPIHQLSIYGYRSFLMVYAVDS